MRKKWLAFLMSAVFIIGMTPGTVHAKTNLVKIETISTPEDMAEAMNHVTSSTRSNNKKSCLKEKDVKSRLIINSQEKPENVYGAQQAYYYSFGKFYVLEYSNAAQAKLAEKKLEQQYDADEVFQDKMITLDDKNTKSSDSKNNTKDDSTDTEEVFDGIKAMGLDQLKEKAETTDWNENNQVTVAVLDTGINVDHSWFKGRIDNRSINLAVDKESSDYDDVTGHGSHVSGIIVKGTTEKVKIMTVRIFDRSESASVLTLRLGVDYATTHGADVMNLSLGYDTKMLKENLGSEDLSFIDDSFSIAADLGATICVASGNEFANVSTSYPACSGWTIAVGSIEPSQTNKNEYIHSDFSNFGELLDFCAPGGNISSAWCKEDGDANADQMNTESGTSMASPHLAAAAAMIKLKNPDYTQWDVYATMRDYVVDLGPEGKDEDFGYGYINLANYIEGEQDTTKKHYQGIALDTALDASMDDKDKNVDLGVQLTKGDGKLSYRSTNNKVATVNEKGIVTIQGGGTCNIVVTASETEQYKETTANVVVKVSKGQQTITVPQTNYTKYEGDEGFWLKASVDKPGDGKLTFIANDNSVVDVREDGYVTIVGTGKTTVYPVASTTASYQRSIGNPITIEVKKASERPKEDKPTTTEIKQTTTAKQNNTVKSNKVTLKQVKKVKVKSGKKQMKINWKNQTQVNGYQIKYSVNKNMKKAVLKKLKGSNKKSVTIKKLKSKKTYYVQIRSYKTVNGKTVYGSWSTKNKARIK